MTNKFLNNIIVIILWGGIIGTIAYLICGINQEMSLILTFWNLLYENSVLTEEVLTVKCLIQEPLFNTVMQTFFIIVMSSWSRAAGPRARVDFLSDLTWKKILFLIVLSLLLIISVNLFI